MPDPATGELKVDPEILLKAKKFNLAISFFYSSFKDADPSWGGFALSDDAFGTGRNASINPYILSSTVANIVTLIRGDLSGIAYTQQSNPPGGPRSTRPSPTLVRSPHCLSPPVSSSRRFLTA